jgi:type I restriction enzyme R subunit
MAPITEDHLEQQCLEWFQNIGYTHVFALDLDSDGSTPERSDFRQVILAARLRKALQRLNPGIAAATLDSAVLQLANPNVPGLLAANRQKHRWLTQGLPITFMDGNEQRGIRLRVIAFDDPAANDWVVVNQLAVQGTKHNRHPDLMVYVNGLPLAVLERPAAGGAGTQEPGRGEDRHLGRLQPAADLQNRHPRPVHRQRAAGDQ